MAAKKKPKVIRKALPETRHVEGVHVVTSDYLPGYEITEVKGLVWGKTVRARFIGHDILAAFKIIAGGEVWPYTDMLNDAVHAALHRMVANARKLGANGVISTRIASSQIVPGTIEVYCYGTAVTAKK